MGIRPCDISRKLLVSHGCVSKILSRYYDTGSINPGSVGGAKAKQIPPLIVRRILQIRNENPFVLPKDIKTALIDHRIYTEVDAPSIASISRVLKHATLDHSVDPDRNPCVVRPEPIRQPLNLSCANKTKRRDTTS